MPNAKGRGRRLLQLLDLEERQDRVSCATTQSAGRPLRDSQTGDICSYNPNSENVAYLLVSISKRGGTGR